MAERKAFLRWADDDLRSLDGQIEFVLRGALRQAGRAVVGTGAAATPRTGSEPSD